MRYYKEILLIEGILFLFLWSTNQYLATLLTFIMVPIFFSIFLISWIAERIEKSKISREYFVLMIGLSILPALLFIMFHLINEGGYGWLTENN